MLCGTIVVLFILLSYGGIMNVPTRLEVLFALGNVVLTERKKLGITQDALARHAGIHQARISQLERGQCDMRISQLHAVLQVLSLELVVQPLFVEPATTPPSA